MTRRNPQTNYLLEEHTILWILPRNTNTCHEMYQIKSFNNKWQYLFLEVLENNMTEVPPLICLSFRGPNSPEYNLKSGSKPKAFQWTFLSGSGSSEAHTRPLPLRPELMSFVLCLKLRLLNEHGYLVSCDSLKFGPQSREAGGQWWIKGKEKTS